MTDSQLGRCKTILDHGIQTDERVGIDGTYHGKVLSADFEAQTITIAVTVPAYQVSRLAGEGANCKPEPKECKHKNTRSLAGEFPVQCNDCGMFRAMSGIWINPGKLTASDPLGQKQPPTPKAEFELQSHKPSPDCNCFYCRERREPAKTSHESWLLDEAEHIERMKIKYPDRPKCIRGEIGDRCGCDRCNP